MRLLNRPTDHFVVSSGYKKAPQQICFFLSLANFSAVAALCLRRSINVAARRQVFRGCGDDGQRRRRPTAATTAGSRSVGRSDDNDGAAAAAAAAADF